MKKSIKIILVILIFAMIAAITLSLKNQEKSSSPIDYSGKWSYISNDTSIILSLTLYQEGNNINGVHCLTYLSGNRIDCNIDDSYSISGYLGDNGVAEIAIDSYYTNEVFERIFLIPQSPNSILLKVENLDEYRAFFPNNIKLTRL